MIKKMNDVDISNLLLGYKRSGSMTRIIGCVPTFSLKISLDNYDNDFPYDVVKDAVFLVQPTDASKTYFYKAYEMPESWDNVLDITLYDCTYSFDVPYETKLKYPQTVKAQLDEMQSLTGIMIDYSSLEQDILNRSINQYDTSITIRSYLRWIAEIGGCNVFASSVGYNRVEFVKFDQTPFVKYTALLDYKKGSPYIISKVTYNDGIRVFDNGGDETSNIYCLSNDSMYIIEQKDISIASSALQGLSIYSASGVVADYTDNLTLGNIVNYNDEFSFVVLNLEESYVGGTAPDLMLDGELTTKNQEAIGVKISNSTKIRRLQVITDEHDSSLEIIAKQQDELGKQQTQLKIGLDGIKETIEKTDENVQLVMKNFTIYLETNRLASQTYDSNANAYVPDFFINNLIVTAHAYDLEGNELNDVKFEWKRKTNSGVESLIAGEHTNGNKLTISHNFDETVTYVCTATLGLISKKDELIVIVTKTGLDGKDGKDGIQGPAGEDGQSQYFHVRYSQNADGNPMSETAVNALYMGTAVTHTSNAPMDYSSYKWTRIKGENGENGIPGAKGADGKTSYLHIKYSDDGLTFTSNNGETPGKYIGVYADFIQTDSSVFNDYTWKKIEGSQGPQGLRGLQGEKGDQGIPGAKGADGKSSYTHIAYANSSDGKTDFSVSDSNRAYIGMYVDSSSTDSTDPIKYAWSKIKGADGAQGTPGKAGADGKTPYLHIAYANSSDGSSGFSVSDSANKLYIGQYTDFMSADSTDYKKYSWTKIKGETGPQGPKGDKGNTGATGPAGKGISTTSIAYQAGTSGTTAPTGEWTSSIPTVSQGQYLWSRTIITYTDGNTSTTYSVAFIPKNGETGAAGTGVDSIAQQYYLSTSKTAQSGGSWVTTMPTWSTGLYLWTRYAITYKNPASTAYTSPICDSSWEAANEVRDEINDALEDTSQSLSELIANARSEFQTEITKAVDEIILSISREYYSKDGTDDLIAKLSTSLEQTEKEFLMKFNSVTKVINDNSKATSDEFEKISKYIRFVDGNIILGEENNQLTLTIQNNKIVFKQTGTELAFFTDGKLYVTNGEFTQSLRIGKFAFVPRTNGSLDFKKVGD
ncbi:MAG: collagen-like protein [Coprobacillus cateniformis]|nr:collagen-like protein [Coprobacillus cateniformis]